MKRKDLYDDTLALNAESRGSCTFAESDEELREIYRKRGGWALAALIALIMILRSIHP